MKNKIIATCCVIIAVCCGYYIFSKPKTYEDCILSEMGKAKNDSAARIIALSCRAKFPEPPNYFDKFDKKY